MTKHDVSFNIPQRALGKADVEFQVKRDGAVLGTLAVSNGSIVWFPKGTSYGYKYGMGKIRPVDAGAGFKIREEIASNPIRYHHESTSLCYHNFIEYAL